MGFFNKIFSGSKDKPAKKTKSAQRHTSKKTVDLTLPLETFLKTHKLKPKTAAEWQKVNIKIVGVSFYKVSVLSVAEAAQGTEFNIYLLPESTNKYDKKAVSVWAGGVQVGYINKPSNKQWFKWATEALNEGEILWGNARAISKRGTDNTGIIGYIFMPRQTMNWNDLEPKKMTDAGLTKSIEKTYDLVETGDDETLSKVRALCKRAAKTVAPLACHAKWILQNPEGQDVNKWDEILDCCTEIFDDADEAIYATDPEEVDILSALFSLEEFLKEIKN